MTRRVKVLHLLNDTALGGVTKALSLYDHPRLAGVSSHRLEAVLTSGRLARRYDADFILTHFPPSWASLAYLLSLRLANPGARIVHVAHSYTRAWEELKVSNRPRFRAMLRLAFHLADQVVAVSEAQGRWLREAAGLRGHRLTVIPPWSGLQGLEQVAPLEPGPGRPLVLGALGRFDEAKGFDTLIEAMRGLDPRLFQLRIGGFGPLEPDLRARAAGLMHVAFAGKISDPAAFFAGCDAVVVPSRWDSYGLVAAEAKAAARPILVADVDGLTEQVGEGGLAIDCKDPAALTLAIQRLARAPLRSWGLAGRADALTLEADRVARWERLFLSGRRRQKAGSKAGSGASEAVDRSPGLAPMTSSRALRAAMPSTSSPGQHR